MGTEIDRQKLADLAGIAFRGVESADIPEKIWVDGYQDTAFVRAAWASGITARRIDRLQDLQLLLADEYGLDFVAVAYWQDMGWDEIDTRAAALKAVL